MKKVILLGILVLLVTPGLATESAHAGPRPLSVRPEVGAKGFASIHKPSTKVEHINLPPGNWSFDFDTGKYVLANEAPPPESDFVIATQFQSGGLLPHPSIAPSRAGIRVALASAVPFSAVSALDFSSLLFEDGGHFVTSNDTVILLTSDRYFAVGNVNSSASGVTFDYALLHGR
jgi:hypothetical protein